MQKEDVAKKIIKKEHKKLFIVQPQKPKTENKQREDYEKTQRPFNKPSTKNKQREDVAKNSETPSQGCRHTPDPEIQALKNLRKFILDVQTLHKEKLIDRQMTSRYDDMTITIP